MNTRERMTWGGKSAAGPVLPVEQAAKKAAEAKKASAHPQTPDEGITHPAGYPDPTQPADYENGDTSSWAEDPHGGPYRTSPAPAVPVDDGGYKHPATQPGAPAKNASHDIRAAVEQKAAKCIRIATALLGKEASGDMIEDQALDFMDLSDARIAATLRRLEAATEDEEVLLRKMLADEEGEEEVEAEGEKEAKKASDDPVAMKLAEVTSALAALQQQMAAMKAGWGHKAEEPPAPAVADDEEAMLAEMLAEEAGKAAAPAYAEDETEAMLKAMLAEEEVQQAPAPEGKGLAQYMDEELDVQMDLVEDPMGLMAEDVPTANDDEVLATLFASDTTGLKTACEDEEEEEEEESEEIEEDDEAEGEKEAKKKAAAQPAQVVAKLKPQPKKASTGAKTVGTQTRVAAAGDLTELSKLWETAPDVTKVFSS